MKRTMVWSLVAVGLLLSGFPGFGTELDLVDQVGQSVQVSQPVERVVSVYGMGTYYLYALGAQDLLVGGGYVGVKSVAQASETLLRMEPRFEDLFFFGDPNPEEILLRDPDLILADGARHAEFAEQMDDLSVPTLQFLVESSDQLREALRLTARALGGEAMARADAFEAEMDRVLEVIGADLAAVLDEERIQVLFLGTSLELVASGDMYQSELIARAGGRSVSQDLFGYWNEVNLEQIIRWDPDVIIIPPYGPLQPDQLLSNPDWASIQAVADGRVYRMPRLIAPMDTPVPESLLGIVWLAGTLYPELVSLGLNEEFARFYRDFYGLELTEDEILLLSGQ